jgi:hypothetical protein
LAITTSKTTLYKTTIIILAGNNPQSVSINVYDNWGMNNGTVTIWGWNGGYGYGSTIGTETIGVGMVVWMEQWWK